MTLAFGFIALEPVTPGVSKRITLLPNSPKTLNCAQYYDNRMRFASRCRSFQNLAGNRSMTTVL
jgi:hypothetical protein